MIKVYVGHVDSEKTRKLLDHFLEKIRESTNNSIYSNLTSGMIPYYPHIRFLPAKIQNHSTLIINEAEYFFKDSKNLPSKIIKFFENGGVLIMAVEEFSTIAHLFKGRNVLIEEL